jgi:ankyrin repeat protein
MQRMKKMGKPVPQAFRGLQHIGKALRIEPPKAAVKKKVLEVRREHPVFKAAHEKKWKKVRHMVARDPSLARKTFDLGPMFRSMTLLHMAASAKNYSMVRYLVRKGADVNAGSKQGEAPPLVPAAMAGDLPIVRFLIKNGADATYVGKEGETLLHAAAFGGNVDVARIFVEKGQSVNATIVKEGITPFHLAVIFGSYPLVTYFVDLGATIDAPLKRGVRPLHFAAMSGNLNVVKFLIDKGASILPTEDGETLLHHALRSGKMDLITYLVEQKGLSVTVADKKGRTPLHKVGFRAQGDNAEVARYLISKGADVNAADNNGNTPLFNIIGPWVKTENIVAFVRALLTAGASVEVVDKLGRTPLRQAAQIGNLAVVKVLVEKGGKKLVAMKDKEGQTALDVARKKNVRNYLKKFVKPVEEPPLPEAVAVEGPIPEA